MSNGEPMRPELKNEAAQPCPRGVPEDKMAHRYKTVGTVVPPPSPNVYLGTYNVAEWITTCERCGFQWTR